MIRIEMIRIELLTIENEINLEQLLNPTKYEAFQIHQKSTNNSLVSTHTLHILQCTHINFVVLHSL